MITSTEINYHHLLICSLCQSGLGNSCQMLLKKANHKPTSENIGTLGMVYHSSAYYDKAAICYKMAEKKKKKEWIWSYYLGYLNQEMGDPNAAIENYRSVIKKNPQAYLAWYYAGECCQKIGSSDSAELAFKYIITGTDKNFILQTAKRYDYFPLVCIFHV